MITETHQRWVTAMLTVPCQGCDLHRYRRQMVLYRGRPEARVMCVGEAPGREEDLVGKPFVGRAGQVLDRMLAYIQLSEETVYITNVVKCRPPDNRTPSEAEIQACLPFLQTQVQIIQPHIILAFGRVAALGLGLLSKHQPLKEVLGRPLTWENRQVWVLYHPAYLLRNASMKSQQAVWLNRIREELQDRIYGGWP